MAQTGMNSDAMLWTETTTLANTVAKICRGMAETRTYTTYAVLNGIRIGITRQNGGRKATDLKTSYALVDLATIAGKVYQSNRSKTQRMAFDGGSSPSWECPNCSTHYVREVDDESHTLDLYGRGL